MIVVDTNILAYLYLPTEHTTRTEALLQLDPDWAAPTLWRSEFRNILAGYLRRKALTFEEATKLQAEAESLMAGSEHGVDSRHVLEPCGTATARPTTASSLHWRRASASSS